MTTTSFKFLIFFPIVVLAYYIIPKRYRQIWLLVASYYFYMSWDVKYGLVLLAVTTVTWSGAILMEWLDGHVTEDRRRDSLKKLCVAALGAAVFGALFCCKYIVFVAGISFYTLQSFGYIMDVYHGKAQAERNFLRYALFLSFFPTVVSGPIERSTTLLRQFRYKERTAFRMENAGRADK